MTDPAAASSGTPGTTSRRLAIGDVVLDSDAHLVTVLGRRVSLAMQEFRLLELLMSRADHVVPSGQILDALWGPQFDGDPSTLAVHVLRVRRKIERDAGGAPHLRTVRGIGYVFDSEPALP